VVIERVADDLLDAKRWEIGCRTRRAAVALADAIERQRRRLSMGRFRSGPSLE
jgi:hypothetical protein